MKKLTKKERLKKIAKLLEGVWGTTREDKNNLFLARMLAKEEIENEKN